ncbi:MAG: helix-turn-helix transcriptional regulator [Oligoflexus sp.]|jgi:predicted DNA-binding transcriptional regulator YafY
MSGRNGQVARFYKILSLLEGAPHGLSVTDILERLRGWGVEVTERTVYRDLEGLKEAGFPLEVKGTNTEGANRWTSEKTTRISDYLVLNAREVLALFMARKLLTPLKETPFYEDLETTFAKIEGKLGSKMQSYLEELEGDLHFEPGPRWGLGLDPEVVETCRTALLERQMLEVEYFSVHKQERSTRVLGPHVMYFAKGSLYLLARDMGDQVIKTFAMPRISRAAMLDQAFTEAPIDPAQFFENSFGVFRGKETHRIELIFTEPVATYVRERRWHASQRVTVLSQRSIRLELDCAITPELIQWILGFGAHVQIMGPQELRDQAIGAASLFIQNHQSRAS